MSRGTKHSQEKIAKALRECEGHVYRTATRLRVSHQTIYNYLEKYPELKEIIKEQKGRVDDAVETKLRKAAKGGQPWAVCFYLKTQCKDRGYVERTESRIGGDKNAPPIQVQGMVSLAELDEIPLEERLKWLEILKKKREQENESKQK